ncbi:C-C chemokine receptor type 5-like protein [Labeo rohita]|uniref:C-C chemokine receptor type 5-like protein n=1 Tax=Labeo rohita TaxID=84645 RepID=A0A498L8R3_LABRO|nr:C-C chemokine receptor type 5-like protein [Labeo rohita]
MRFTVVHICAAHMVKTFSNAARRQTKDKGLHNFAVFCFALLQNSITLQQAKAIFLQMCFVFLAEKNTPTVEAAVVKLNNYIKQIALDVEDDIFLKASIPTEDDIQMSKNTIIGRSQFTSEFLKVREESMDILEKEELSSTVEDNVYRCEGIVNLLTGHYLGLFPLWSGIFLGNMEKYATESKKTTGPKEQVTRTRDTNSQGSATTSDYSEYYDNIDNYGAPCNGSNTEAFTGVFFPILYSTTFIVGLIGNALVLWVLIRNRQRSSLTDVCFLNLALCDLLFVVSLPFWAHSAAQEWVFGTFACHAVSGLVMMGLYGSVFFMVLMTLDRYVIVVYKCSICSRKWPANINSKMALALFVWTLNSCSILKVTMLAL